jgi:tetratricopeptide (TPR) repeat protein
MTLRGHDNGVEDSIFSPDGKRIISGGYDKTIKVWDAATGAELMTLCGHELYVQSLAFSLDGKRIVSGGYDKTIKIWDAATGDELMTLRGHKGCVNSVAFGPEGKRIVSGSYDKTIKIWGAATGAELRTLRGHSANVLSVMFSPDGKRIVSGSEDRTVKLWDAANGVELMTLRGHRNWIEPVAFSPDGKRIISGSGDSTIKVWDTATGAELMSLRVLGAPSSIAFSPDGKTIAAGIYGNDDNIELWESTAPAGGYEARWSVRAAKKVVDELVDELYKETGFHGEVIDRLKADKALDESVCKMAIHTAKARLWDAIQELQTETFEVVRLPGEQIEAYRVALDKAERANHLDPNDPHILIILGLAQYRVGAYQDVLMTLKECEDWRPGPFVTKAMALHQLGRTTEAREALNQAHVLLEGWEYGAYFTVLPFVVEAEKLLASEGTKLYSVWESIQESRLKEAAQMIGELRSSKDAEATTHIEGAVKSLRKAYYNRAENMIIDGRFDGAISDYEEAVRVDPGYAPAFDGLAWLRATCMVAEFRDGVKAVEQATKACELTNFKKTRYIGTLAAAYAETGDFDSAVKWQKKAIDLLTEKQEYLSADFEERLKLYQSGKPYRESP